MKRAARMEEQNRTALGLIMFLVITVSTLYIMFHML